MCYFPLYFPDFDVLFFQKNKKACCSVLLKKITCCAKREKKITCREEKSQLVTLKSQYFIQKKLKVTINNII